MTPPLPSAAAGHSSAARFRHLFTARLPDSTVGLSLAARTPYSSRASGRATLDAASALYQAERWLPALEDWLGTGLVPQLTTVTEPLAESLMFNQHVTVSSAEIDARLHLPISTLRGLREPPPAPFSQWSWKPVRTELVLDTLPLGPSELDALEVGALVLLPASFATPSWTGTLQPVSRQGGSFGARLYESGGRLCATGTGDEASSAPNDHATARFRRPVEATPFELFGWRDPDREPTPFETPELLSAGAILIQSSPVMKSQPLATGQLIPVGSGFAIRIDAVPPSSHRPTSRTDTTAG